MAKSFNLDETLNAQSQVIEQTQADRNTLLLPLGGLVLGVGLLIGDLICRFGIPYASFSWRGLFLTVVSLQALFMLGVHVRTAFTPVDLLGLFSRMRKEGKFEECTSDKDIVAIMQKEQLSSGSFAIILCALMALASSSWYVVTDNAFLYFAAPLFFLAAAMASVIIFFFRQKSIENLILHKAPYRPSFSELLKMAGGIGVATAILLTGNSALLDLYKKKEGLVNEGLWMTQAVEMSDEVFSLQWEDSIKASHPEFGDKAKIIGFFESHSGNLYFRGAEYVAYTVVMGNSNASVPPENLLVVQYVPASVVPRLTRMLESHKKQA